MDIYEKSGMFALNTYSSVGKRMWDKERNNEQNVQTEYWINKSIVSMDLNGDVVYRNKNM